MKIDIILICHLMLIGCSVIYAGHFSSDAEREKITEECAKEGGMELSELKELFRDETDEGKRKNACFHACRFRKQGLLDGNRVNADSFCEISNQFHDNDEEREIACNKIRDCAMEVENLTDECDVASAFHQCTMNHHHRRHLNH